VLDQQLTVVGVVVYNSYGAHLFTADTASPPRISEYAEERRTEQNLIVRSSKSEAEVTNKCVNYMQHPVPLFKGNISVAHCMPLSTRLKGSRMMSPPGFQT